MRNIVAKVLLEKCSFIISAFVSTMKKEHYFQTKHTNDITKEMYFKADGQKVFGIYVLGIPIYNIRDPELIRRILVKDFDHFVDRQANQFRKFSRSKTDEVMGSLLFFIFQIFCYIKCKWR